VAVEALTILGARVETVENGQEAVQVASAGACDIILMDGSMPTMDGFTASKIIRQGEECSGRKRIPIVALTAHTMGKLAREWAKFGYGCGPLQAIYHCEIDAVLVGARASISFIIHAVDAAEDRPEYKTDPLHEARCVESKPDESPLDINVWGLLRGQHSAETPGSSNSNFIARIVTLYSEHATKACEQMRQDALDGDSEQLGAAAHALKSMSLNIGARDVARVSARFEQMVRHDGRMPVQKEFDELDDALERTLSALAQEIGGPCAPERMADAHVLSLAVISSADEFQKDLHLAIERDEIDVEYQPFVDRVGHRVLGVEALVRWNRGGIDEVSPSRFVPVAEKSGFISALGDWVLRRACQDAHAWPGLTVAVNISAAQIKPAGIRRSCRERTGGIRS